MKRIAQALLLLVAVLLLTYQYSGIAKADDPTPEQLCASGFTFFCPIPPGGCATKPGTTCAGCHDWVSCAYEQK